ncbi:sigma-70 family RNA polymerase sigma factor [Faecalitalea cylindroides]|uniref:RNA polymerase sigma factor, sigma-70 family n=2 Tax=Faecalitalea cylindroides TaxID=39483 RepID=U2P8I1_9FIRM|nr:sigma-70 family RNA polymerase sigma factor [Faecalitalea cylindroides]ERK46820.1 hypothetical protein HMPREF0367_00369 [[Eubacterium] cylindroides ATCC 27803] [Faecalitalea cylindroides ATCC 27803]
MSYIKGKEQQKWTKWKENEERSLRSLNFPEDKINSLREFDWYQFKQERRFKERESVYNESFFINVSNKTIQSLDLSNLLNNLDDAILYRCILKSDIVTKKIINLKVNDYSTKEIAKILDITPNVIYKKIYFLRKKYRKLAKFKRY